MGRIGETWGGWGRHGKDGRYIGRVCTSRRWCVLVLDSVYNL